MNPIDLAYLAGIIDGEGCIGLHKFHTSKKLLDKGLFRVTLRITIVNRNKELMEWIKIKTKHKYGRAKTGYYYWIVGCKKARILLRKILPYLVTKKPQAELALSLPISTYHPNPLLHMRAFDKMKELKRKSYGKGMLPNA